MSGNTSCSRAGMAAMLRTASSLKSSITGTIAQCWFALLPHELRCPQVVMTVQQPIAQCSLQSSCSTHTLSGTGSHAACADPARTALVGDRPGCPAPHRKSSHLHDASYMEQQGSESEQFEEGWLRHMRLEFVMQHVNSSVRMHLCTMPTTYMQTNLSTLCRGRSATL